MAVLILILGCFVEVAAMFFLALPVVMPIIEAMNISKVFFGVVFTIAGMTGISFDRVVRATIPFSIPPIVTILLLVLFPNIVTFLPDLLMK